MTTQSTSSSSSSGNWFYAGLTSVSGSLAAALEVVEDSSELQQQGYEVNKDFLKSQASAAKATADFMRASGDKESEATSMNAYASIGAGTTTIGMQLGSAVDQLRATSNSNLGETNDKLTQINTVREGMKGSGNLVADMPENQEEELSEDDLAKARERLSQADFTKKGIDAEQLGKDYTAVKKAADLNDPDQVNRQTTRDFQKKLNSQKEELLEDRKFAHNAISERSQKWNQISQGLSPIVQGAVQTAAAAAQAVKAVEDALQQVARYTLDAFGSAVQSAGQNISNQGQNISSAVQSLLDGIARSNEVRG